MNNNYLPKLIAIVTGVFSIIICLIYLIIITFFDLRSTFNNIIPDNFDLEALIISYCYLF